MTSVPARSLGERLARVTASCADIDTLARAVFDTLATQVPFVFACLATVDPASGMITRAVKSSPLEIGDEQFAAAEYGAPDINRFTELTTRAVPVGVLSRDTDGHVDRCRRMREYMTPVFGFTDELRVSCRSRSGAWAAFALYRGPGDAPFTGRDGETVAAVHEIVADRVRGLLFRGDAGRAFGTPGAAVLVVDAADRVTDLTASAQARVEDLGGWDHGSLPANALAVIAHARAHDEAATSRVLGRTGAWLALRAMPLGGAGSASGRSVVLTIDAAGPADIGQLRLSAHGLTAREQDVARQVLSGASTKAIAAALHLSPHTVQDHLKAIFAKLGVSSRREMIAQLVLAE